MTAYYNEIDPYAAQWLRNLIDAGHIAPGVVDERSIEDVTPADLNGFTQCHFFAGIGVWSLALRRAGWPDNRPVWTGSCPCQPFSAAGKSARFDDERHLWPAFHWLIGECRPGVIIGEQVASKAAEPWLDLVQIDLEALGYAFGAVAFPSASVGAPYIRDRTFWVASSNSKRFDGINPLLLRLETGRIEKNCVETSWGREVNGFWRDAEWRVGRDGRFRPVEPGTFPLAHGAASRVGRLRAYGNAINAKAAEEFIRCVM